MASVTNGADAKSADKSPKPSRILPTNRIAFQKQLDILRAFGAASEPNGRSVALGEVSGIVGLHVNTISLINPFLVDVQFVQRSADGMVPSPEVVEFTRAYEWNRETAATKLAPVLLRAWFAQLLLPKLRFRPVPREEAIQDLASASSAAPLYRGQLETLLEYMQVAGIISLENDQVRLLQGTGQAVAHSPPAETSRETQSQPTETRDAVKHAPVVTAFSNPAAGVVQFQVSVKVDMAEFAGWEPQRITAFFAGIAQVLAAKGAVEERATTI